MFNKPDEEIILFPIHTRQMILYKMQNSIEIDTPDYMVMLFDVTSEQ